MPAWGCAACSGRLGLSVAGRGYAASGWCALGAHRVKSKIHYFAEGPAMGGTAVAHSKLGASISKRFMSCPGSVNLCRTLPPSPGTEYSREGTFLHALTTYCLRKGDVTARNYLGCSLGVNPDDSLAESGDIEVTADHVAAVDACLDHAWGLIAPETSHWTEQRFHLADIDERMFGTNDLAILVGTTLHVIDYKFGRGVPVEVEGNSQLLYYGLGAVRELSAHGACPERLALTIIQPRCPHADGPVRTWEIDLFDLAVFEAELAAAVKATDAPDAPLVAGDHCKFCPGTRIQDDGKLGCPAFAARTAAAHDDAFSVMADPPAMATMSLDEIARRLGELPLLREYIKQFEAFARNVARDKGLPGYAWAPGRRSWKWAGGLEAILTAAAEHKLDAGALIVRSPVTPVQAEKALGRDAFAKLEELVDRGTTAPTLKPEKSVKSPMPIEAVRAYYQEFNDAAFDAVE